MRHFRKGERVKILMFEEEYQGLLDHSIGVCVECGTLRECCEPDAEEYKCDACGMLKAFGLEALMVSGVVGFEEERTGE